MLIISSDGISEAENQQGEQFGEDRIQRLGLSEAGITPAELCERVIGEVGTFACAGIPPDDRTLLVVRFPHRDHASPALEAERARVETAA